MKFGAIVTAEGRLVFDRRPEWEAALASFAGKVDRQGKPLRVTLTPVPFILSRSFASCTSM